MTSSHMYKLLVWLCCVLCVQYAQAQEKYMFQPIGHNEPIPIGIRQSWGLDNVDTSGRWCEPITPDNLFTTYKGLIPLGKHDSLALEDRFIPGKGQARYDYLHYYKGILVHSSYFNVTTWNGKVIRISDAILRNLDIDTNKVVVSVRQAGQMLRDSAKAHCLEPFFSFGLKKMIQGANLVYENIIVSYSATPYQTWIFHVNSFNGNCYFSKPYILEANLCYHTCASSYQPIVPNCSSGDTTIYTNVDISGCPTTTAYAYIPVRGMKGDTTAYCVLEEMEYCDTTSPDIFRLARNTNRSLKVNYSLPELSTTYPYSVGNPVYFGRPVGNEAPYVFKDDILIGVNAFWGVSKALNYWSTMGVQGYNGKDSMTQVVIKSPFVGNAAWAATQLPVKNQIHITQNISKALLYSSEEVMAHEFAHGVLLNTFFVDQLGIGAALGYNTFETAALHEGLADIFAILVDRYVDKLNLGDGNFWWEDWKFGTTSEYTRVLSNPALSDVNIGGVSYHQAKTYQGAYWNTHLGAFTPAASDTIPIYPGGKQYIAAGIPTYWFYLLTKGGSDINDANQPFNLTGIGIDKAEKILHKGLAIMSPSLLTANRHPQFGDLRNATIRAAQIEYGNCSAEMTQTILAWQAVGVGKSTPPT
jgi:Zn-dependent metalloprotease